MNKLSWPKIDTIKAVATYTIAAYIVFKVLNMLSDLAALDPNTFGVAAVGIVGTTIAGVTAFLFGIEQGKQQQMNQQKAFETGLAAPSTTVQNADKVETGGPTTVTAERQFAQGSASSVPPLEPPKPEK